MTRCDSYFKWRWPRTNRTQFAHLSFDKLSAGLPLPINRGADVFSFQLATSHPFPTLWTAKDDTSTIIKLLPPEEDLFYYLDAFQRRAQAFSYPHVPSECNPQDVRQFLDHIDHNAALHPDMLALLFTTLALGLQDGVYDRCGETWVAGSVESEAKKGEVYSMLPDTHRMGGQSLTRSSRGCHAMSETELLHESPYLACHRSVGDDGTLSYQQWQVS